MEAQLRVTYFLYHSKKTSNGQVPIYMRIRYQNDTISLSTGLSTKASNWDKKAKKLKGINGTSTSNNETLKVQELKVRNVFNQLILTGKPFTIHTLKNQLLGSSDNSYTLQQAFDTYLAMIKSLIGKDYSPLTLTKYKQTETRILEFVVDKFKRQTVYLSDLNDMFMTDFEHYLKTEIGNNQTTVYKHWQRLSRVLRFAVRRKMLSTFPFNDYSIKLPKKKVEFLSMDELNRVEENDYGTERLNTIKDFFVFSCYTGLAYTEILNLSRGDLTTGADGGQWINMYRQKTKKPYSVPLLPKALSIINRYLEKNKSSRTNKIFPIPSNQKMNAYLKEIQSICKIETKLTCHLARKTFACTIMLLNGASIQVVSQCLGHSNIRITIDAYSSVVPEMIIREFAMLKKKLE